MERPNREGKLSSTVLRGRERVTTRAYPSAPSVFIRYRSCCAGTETNKMKDTNMTSPKQIRCIAIATLAISIVLAVGSVWFNREARLAPDTALAQRGSSAPTHPFTFTRIFILIGGYEV